MTATTKGSDDLRSAVRAAAAQVRRGAERAVAAETDATEDDMRRGAPVDEGELRRLIASRASGLRGEVRSRARHSSFVEHGTYKDPAQPFAQPAAARVRRRLPRRVAAEVRRAVE